VLQCVRAVAVIPTAGRDIGCHMAQDEL